MAVTCIRICVGGIFLQEHAVSDVQLVTCMYQVCYSISSKWASIIVHLLYAYVNIHRSMSRAVLQIFFHWLSFLKIIWKHTSVGFR